MLAKTAIVLGILLCAVVPLVPTAFPGMSRRVVSAAVVIGAILIVVGAVSVLLDGQLGFTPDR